MPGEFVARWTMFVLGVVFAVASGLGDPKRERAPALVALGFSVFFLLVWKYMR